MSSMLTHLHRCKSSIERRQIYCYRLDKFRIDKYRFIDYNRFMSFKFKFKHKIQPHAKEERQKAFSTKSKRAKYNELITQQKKLYDQVIAEVKKEYPSWEGNVTGNITPKHEPMQYT